MVVKAQSLKIFSGICSSSVTAAFALITVIKITISLIVIGLKYSYFSTNSLAKLLSDSLLLDILLLDILLLDSLLSDSSIGKSHSKL